MKRGRTIRALLLTPLVAALLLLASLLWLKEHPAGRRLLARAAERRLGDQLDCSARIAGLAGDLPWRGSAASVTLLDDEGAWLAATNLTWQLRPSSWRFWRLPLRCEILDADRLTLRRLPRRRQAPPQRSQARSHPLLNIELLHIGSLEIAPEIHGLPLPASWQLHARGTLRGDAVEARVLARASPGAAPPDDDNRLSAMTAAASLRADFGAAGTAVTATQALARLPGLALQGAFAWRQSAWRLTARADATNTPPLIASLAREERIGLDGASADFTLAGGPEGIAGQATFTAQGCTSRWASAAALRGGVALADNGTWSTDVALARGVSAWARVEHATGTVARLADGSYTLTGDAHACTSRWASAAALSASIAVASNGTWGASVDLSRGVSDWARVEQATGTVARLADGCYTLTGDARTCTSPWAQVARLTGDAMFDSALRAATIDFEASRCVTPWAALARLAGRTRLSLSNSPAIHFAGMAKGVTNDLFAIARLDDLIVRLAMPAAPLLEAEAVCRDLRTPWTDSARLHVALQAEGGKTNRLQLALDGGPTVTKWGTLDALAGEAQLRRAGDGRQDRDSDCRLLRLEAAAGAQRLVLRSPGAIARRAGAWQWDDLVFAAGGGEWHSSGRVAPDALAATLSTTNLPAAGLPQCPPALAESAATLRVWLSGTPAAPRLATEALLAPVMLRPGADRALPPLALSAHAGYDGTALRATLDAVGWPWRLLRVTAEAPLRISLSPWSMRSGGGDELPPWNARLLFSGDLEQLEQVLNFGGVHARGALEGDLSLAGPLAHPRLGGLLELRDGYAEHPASGVVLRDIRLRAIGEGDRLTLHEGSVSDGERGGMDLTGGMRLSPDARPMLDVRIRPRRLTLWRAGDSRMAISGQGILTGSLARACLTGRFAIVDTQVRLNRSRPVIATLPVAGLEDGQELFFREEARRPSRWLALDADFYSGQPVSVEGRGLASSWDVALHVGGTADAPELRGAATMRDGRLHFMGHRFKLARARLLLDGAWPPLPALAGEASAKAGGIEAHLRLSGTLAQPRLDLRSTPDLPPEEIVSRLLFGHESQGISPFQAARLAYGLEVLRGEQPLFDMLERGQDLIRADELEFTQDDDSHGSALAVGKRLGERVTLRGEKGFGGASDRVLLQIELLPSLILETEAGTQMREGVGLRWRLDY